MPLFQKADKRILFVHVPKAAGSSIEQHFTNSGWSMELFKPCKSPYEPADQHLTYEGLRNHLHDIDDITSFTVVRNPFRRMVSEWRWQVNTMRTTSVGFDHFVRRCRSPFGTREPTGTTTGDRRPTSSPTHSTGS